MLSASRARTKNEEWWQRKDVHSIKMCTVGENICVIENRNQNVVNMTWEMKLHSTKHLHLTRLWSLQSFRLFASFNLSSSAIAALGIRNRKSKFDPQNARTTFLPRCNFNYRDYWGLFWLKVKSQKLIYTSPEPNEAKKAEKSFSHNFNPSVKKSFLSPGY